MLLEPNSTRADSYLGDLAGLYGYGCTINVYGDSIQVISLGFCSKDILEQMGFEYSKRKDFYWKKY